MAGQVKHKQIFSSIRPDWKLAKLLLSLGTRNTDSLLGAVAKTWPRKASRWRIQPRFWSRCWRRQAFSPSVRRRRRKKRTSTTDAPSPASWRSMISGKPWWSLSPPVWRSRPWKAPTPPLRRAGEIMRSLGGEASTLGRELTVVKIAKPNQDMRFDVPVVGVKTIEVMRQAGATCLALDAGKMPVAGWERHHRGRRFGRHRDRGGLKRQCSLVWSIHD